MKHLLGLIFVVGAMNVALAQSPQSLIAVYESQAGAGFRADVARGQAFYGSKGKEWSCATCHRADPMQAGEHVITGRAIKPMAVSANPARFTSASKVEKWFGRNCTEVIGRECSAAEKADFIAYLLSVK